MFSDSDNMSRTFFQSMQEIYNGGEPIKAEIVIVKNVQD